MSYPSPQFRAVNGEEISRFSTRKCPVMRTASTVACVRSATHRISKSSNVQRRITSRQQTVHDRQPLVGSADLTLVYCVRRALSSCVSRRFRCNVIICQSITVSSSSSCLLSVWPTRLGHPHHWSRVSITCRPARLPTGLLGLSRRCTGHRTVAARDLITVCRAPVRPPRGRACR